MHTLPDTRIALDMHIDIEETEKNKQKAANGCRFSAGKQILTSIKTLQD